MATLDQPTWQYEEQLDAIATQIWRSIVSDTLPKVPHYKHWVISKPAKHIGGDFHLASDDCVFVGDVSGKGIPAALLTGMFVAALKLAAHMRDPGKAVEQALYDELERSEKFATLAALKLGADGWMTYLTLGHPPIIAKTQKNGLLELRTPEPPIGTIRKSRYAARTLRLEPGDWICLYTDGVIEAERDNGEAKELFGLGRLKMMVHDSACPKAFFTHVTDELKQWTLTDDLTLVLLQYQPETNWLDERLERR
jgi:phosphoserine phosphatase RsbU/P